MSVKKWLLFFATMTSISSSRAHGQTIFQGMRGPTNLQLDERLSFSKSEQDVNVLANNLILKYWDGSNFGKFGFINIPYKFIDSQNGSNSGMGDISIGVGPRGTIKNLNLIPYFSLTFPTGETKGIATGNGRVDKKVGMAATYLFHDRNAELTSSFEYNSTGKNHHGINPPNEVSAGFITGYKFGKIRTATGLVGLVKGNGDFLLNLRNGIRYTLSPKLHFELYGDLSVKNKTIPRNKSLSAFVRYNY